MNKNKKIGWLLILWPFVGLLTVLVLWAITSFVVSSLLTASPVSAATIQLAQRDPEYFNNIINSYQATQEEQRRRQAVYEAPTNRIGYTERTASPALAMARILNVFFGFLGIICVLGIFISVPIGIMFLAKKEFDPHRKYDERSGKGDQSVVPDEIKGGWNWGAAGLTIIWGLYHGVWISLLAFVPILNWFWWIFMGVYGNEWAWKKQKWESVQQFKDSQRKWMPFGIAIFVIWGLYVFSVFGSFFNNL